MVAAGGFCPMMALQDTGNGSDRGPCYDAFLYQRFVYILCPGALLMLYQRLLHGHDGLTDVIGCFGFVGSGFS